MYIIPCCLDMSTITKALRKQTRRPSLSLRAFPSARHLLALPLVESLLPTHPAWQAARQELSQHGPSQLFVGYPAPFRFEEDDAGFVVGGMHDESDGGQGRLGRGESEGGEAEGGCG